MTTTAERAKEIEIERSRPDGVVVVTLDELRHTPSTIESPTAGIRYLDGVLQQMYRVEIVSGIGALVGVKHEWRNVPNETVKPYKD